MAEFTQEDIAHISDYFEKFTLALAANLRLHKGKLGSYWSGIDATDFSTVLYFSSDGLVARVIGKWLGERVRVHLDKSFDRATKSRWENHDFRSGTDSFASAVIKSMAGPPQVAIRAEGDFLQIVPMNRGGSVLALGPLFYKGLTAKQGALVGTLLSDKERDQHGLAAPRPPWLVSLISSRTGQSTLDGLDPEPFISAKGVADMICKIAGLIDDAPSKRYRKARERLAQAVATINQENERAIHAVIKEYPWILVNEVDYVSMESERTLRYTERIKDSDGAPLREVKREVRPDFLYHLHDNETLVVEIEAATKALLIATQETSYQSASASATKAQYQIRNYKHICSGPFGAQINVELNQPDHSRFRYLLVVGSVTQPTFDRRSWERQKVMLAAETIELRDWDYYLNRLKRLEDAATPN